MRNGAFRFCFLSLLLCTTLAACDNGGVVLTYSGPAITAVALGQQHSCVLRGEDGSVWCVGYNQYGQIGDKAKESCYLGDGDYGACTKKLVLATGFERDITQVSVGEGFTCVLTKDGAVKCRGYNNYGNLGNGTRQDTGVLSTVSGLDSGVKAIAAGWHHACALLSNGGIKCWGNNETGGLGDGTTTQATTPVEVQELGGVAKAIAAGSNYSCALLDDGTLKCWGNNMLGQLGIKTDKCGKNYSPCSVKPLKIEGLDGAVVEMSLGESNSCAVTEKGSLFCWGLNEYGQLGIGSAGQFKDTPTVVPNLSGVKHVAVGDEHTCAALQNNAVFCWGENFGLELGSRSKDSIDDGEFPCSFTPLLVPGLSGSIQELVATSGQACVLQTDHSVYCWGTRSGGVKPLRW